MKLKFSLLSLLVTLVFNHSLFAQKSNNFCGHEHDQLQYWNENPDAYEDFKNLLKSARTLENINGKKRMKFIIPVVFHVIHNDGNENIDDNFIVDQLKVLNDDFQLLNSDTNTVDPAFKELIANCNFEFRLATIDPKGNCTTGINHIKSFLTENSQAFGKLNQWNRSKYLNIWVVKSFPPISNGEVLGRAYLPSSVGGMLFYADGVTVLAKEIVKNSRTLTHEVGHYLGLQHTFNSDINNNQTGGDCGDDGIFDTPRTKGGSYNTSFTCSNGATNTYTELCDVNNFIETNDFNSVTTTSGKIDSTSIVGKLSYYPLKVVVGNYTTDTTNFINSYPQGAKFLFKTKNISTSSSSKIKVDFSNWKTGAKEADTTTSTFSQNVDTTKYYEITYSSSNGNSIDIKGINFIVSRNKEGVRSVTVRSSSDNYKSNLNLGLYSSTKIRNISNVANFKYDSTHSDELSFFVNNPTKLKDVRDGKTIKFRIYGWNSENATGTLGIETIQLIGDTTKVNLSNVKAVGVGNNSTKAKAYSFDSWDLGANDKETSFSNLKGSINSNKYYEFQVTAKKRKLINIDSITFYANRNDLGVRTFVVKSSVDNFQSALSMSSKNTNEVSINSNTLFFKKDTTLGAKVKITTSLKDIRENQTISFRIYGFNAEDSKGTLELDSIKVYGLGSTIENYQNYMDYSNCPTMFTKDQASLMTAILTIPQSIRHNLYSEANLKSTGTNELTTVVCKPESYFSYNITHLCNGGLVTFRDKSWGSKATSRVWNFQDGKPSTDTSASPKVIFSSPGYKKVSLHIKNAIGEDSLVIQDAVYVSPENAQISDLFSHNFNDGAMSDWLVVNQENNFSKFQVENGRWGSKGLKLNTFKDISNATFENIDDMLYYQRIGGTKDAIISPSIDFTKITDSKLNFDYSYATTSFYDSLITEKLEVSYSTNCGRTWIPMHTICYLKDVAETASYDEELVTAGIYSGKEYTPNSDDVWKTAVIDLAPIVQNTSKSQVRIKLEFTASSYSNNLYIDNINLFGTVGITESPLTQMDIAIVPNPTSNENGINIEFNGNNENVTIELIDLQGKLIKSETLTGSTSRVNHQLKVTDKLIPGFYTLRVSQGEFSTNKKVVIQ
jgi:hypothetical protein